MLFHRIPILKIFSEKKFRVYLFDNPEESHSEIIRLCIADWLDGRLDCFAPAHVHWSKSDTGTWLAVAVSSKRIGVDIETMRERNYEKISKRFFDASEVTDDVEKFYEEWVRKEAYWKKAKKGIGGRLGVAIPKGHGIITLEGLPDNLAGAVSL